MGYRVSLIAAGAPTREEAGVQVIGVRAGVGRRDRMFTVTRLLYRAALALDADLYHFHDPELMPVGVRLKLAGKKVVYDVHEELSNDILDKKWIRPWLRPVVAWSVGLVERLCSLFYDGIVITRPALYKHFDRRKTVLVHNYPILGELAAPGDAPYAGRPPVIAYVGGGSPERGIRELVDALALLPESCDLELRFAGLITPPEYFAELQTRPGWKRVRYLGWQSRAQVAELLASARMGVVVFLPIANHMNSEPTKLFEYMSAKLPVVASNIPHWVEMIEGQNYAEFADPTDPAAIATALRRLHENPSDAEQMGLRGYQAVMSQFNWQVASDNLGALYRQILA
jgi:glycosyltransferase involved in cell wall biosynthesis